MPTIPAMSDIPLIVAWLLLVNGLPPFVTVLLHGRFDHPIDNRVRWSDGRPLFGPHKTIRGLVAAAVGGALAAPLLLGLDWLTGGTIALCAMAGDLLSSFIKRRRNLASGADAIFLDQFFEALLPLIAIGFLLGLGPLHIITALGLFILLAFLSSSLWRHITERPLPPRYPRMISSTVRFKEWRSCHTPLARYQVWFNLTSFLSDQILLTWLFTITGLYRIGLRNAHVIERTETTFYFDDLPAHFDGIRILFLTDLHLDGAPGIAQSLMAQLAGIRPDICLMGGDLRMKIYGDSTPAINQLREIMQGIDAPLGTFGVLGNHDCIEMLPEIEDTGVVMLVNDAVRLNRGDQSLWVAGVDDPHYYRLADATQAMEEIPDGDFAIFLAHSPESYMDAAQHGAKLYLCGHTHGGQVCLPGGVPIITNSRAPRFTASGRWRHRDMQGYTSRGVAPSSIPVRFNCPGEVTCITLRRG